MIRTCHAHHTELCAVTYKIRDARSGALVDVQQTDLRMGANVAWSRGAALVDPAAPAGTYAIGACRPAKPDRTGVRRGKNEATVCRVRFGRCCCSVCRSSPARPRAGQGSRARGCRNLLCRRTPVRVIDRHRPSPAPAEGPKPRAAATAADGEDGERSGQLPPNACSVVTSMTVNCWSRRSRPAPPVLIVLSQDEYAGAAGEVRHRRCEGAEGRVRPRITFSDNDTARRRARSTADPGKSS